MPQTVPIWNKIALFSHPAYQLVHYIDRQYKQHKTNVLAYPFPDTFFFVPVCIVFRCIHFMALFRRLQPPFHRQVKVRSASDNIAQDCPPGAQDCIYM